MTEENLSIKNHDYVLNRIAEELDISPSKYEEAVRRYEALGNWLDRENSSIADLGPEIRPQGSFLLGTVIKPLHDGEEYDIDLVCRLQARRSEITQKDLKEMVGVEIASYAQANSMARPDDGRRCWTLNYADSAKFHMDILPAIPDADRYRQLLTERGFVEVAGSKELTDGAISITDKQHPSYAHIVDDWHQSNPQGYAAWFRMQMLPQIQEQKRHLMRKSALTASIDDIPDHKVKTPLQRAIQLLKRHRDNMFKDNGEHKPISIIITTLSAKSYNNEDSVAGALESILTGMHHHIENRNGVNWIANPVNPAENFADKWAENRQKEKNFFAWLEAARRDFGMYLHGRSYDRLPEALAESFGNRITNRVLGTATTGAISAPAVARAREDEETRIRIAAAERQSSGRATRPWQTH